MKTLHELEVVHEKLIEKRHSIMVEQAKLEIRSMPMIVAIQETECQLALLDWIIGIDSVPIFASEIKARKDELVKLIEP